MVVPKARTGNEIVERRDIELKELLGIDGGIVGFGGWRDSQFQFQYIELPRKNLSARSPSVVPATFPATPELFLSPDFLSSLTSTTKLPNSQSQQPHTMGTGKKEANRKIRQGKVGDGMANVKTKGENFYRLVISRVDQKEVANKVEVLRRKSKP